MDVVIQQKSHGYKIALLMLAVLFCTYFRVSLLLIYPLIVAVCFYIFHWKLDKNVVYILLLVLLFWIASLRDGLFIKYNLVSLYYFVPFILLLFVRPAAVKINYLKIFMTALTIIAFINNIAGLIQYINKPNDDSFVGIYGIFTVSQNGLSLVNSVLFFYYLTEYQERGKLIYILLFTFFLVCGVLGFYGAGLIVLIAALFFTYLKIRKKNILQLIAISLLTISAVILLMKTISPNTYDYNMAIVKRFISPTAETMPRKLIIFQNYLQGYSSDILDMVFGSGPGTFNSRTAFMVGSPSYFNVEMIKSEAKPHYFISYAYPLWNPSNTGPYDGFMNQPFASILALLGEYGLMITAIIFALAIKNFMRVKRGFSSATDNGVLHVPGSLYRFCMYFTFFLIVIDNYIEYPEIIGLLLIIIKLSEQQLKNHLSSVSNIKLTT